VSVRLTEYRYFITGVSYKISRKKLIDNWFARIYNYPRVFFESVVQVQTEKKI